jgi:diketogulonate reductase-like aldo/keto reductase
MHAQPTEPEPCLIYGTAWKEERTEALVRLALSAGFRAIDTANQRKHYVEAAVGAALAGSGVPREQLFLQTKYTYARGQDQRLPYAPGAAIAEQVRQSFASSLEHLGVAYVDAYLLHGPWSARGVSVQDYEAWGAMEALQRTGVARAIGVSNVSYAQLETLYARASVKPAFVQNRCYANTGWDRAVRAFCRTHGMRYQGFSLLTANRTELARPQVEAIAGRLGASVAQVVFRFAREVGMLPLTGTSDPVHMAEDLACSALALSAADLRVLEGVH